ncbi:MAG TPA: ATP-binding protein [Bacilli bacterium]|nr:ATP-binding protein [Bacilli bacterium]
MDVVKDLVFQIVIVVLPILFYQVLWVDRMREKEAEEHNRFLLGLLFTGAIVVSMLFANEMFPGHYYDLRTVLIVLTVWYGGLPASLIALAMLVGFRLYLGGEGLAIFLTNSAIWLTIAYWVAKRFQTYRRQKKVWFAALFVLLKSSTIIGFTMIRVLEHGWVPIDGYWLSCLLFPLLHVFAMIVAVSLLENLQEAIAMRIERQRQQVVIGQLAAAVTHEVRNPMTVARGFMQLLNEKEIPQDSKPYVQLVISELDRAHTIISDFLTFAKPQQESEQVIDVAERVQQVVDVISSYSTLQNVEIVHNLEAGLTVIGDAEKLNQVLMNVMKNGIEAMERGGCLVVQAFRRRELVVIKVIDNGAGMSPEEIRKLGTPYYSTKAKGTGLGMMVCHRIIDTMHGKIEIESEKGVGTQFSVLLPLHRA